MSIAFERGKAYTVDRGAPKQRNGQGMLAGLAIVFQHFRDALTKKLDDPSKTSGVFTIQYPEERMRLPEATRNFPILLFEDASGQELCTSCFQCERICPPQVIHITQAKDPVSGKPVPAIAEFLIEYDACMSCGLCAEVCPFDAIKMDHDYELATSVHGGLTINRTGLMRPISYYEELAPTFWNEVKDGALKKLQGSSKRRPGTIGIAPQLVERILAERRAAAPVAPVPLAEPLPTLATPAPATQSEVATTGDTKADKAAKLAAIRAANAVRPTDPTSLATPEAQTTTTSATTGDTKADKAAKLAAIRAANAVKQDQATGVVAEQATATPEPAALPASGDAKADKAARLAAIRAANAAKQDQPTEAEHD